MPSFEFRRVQPADTEFCWILYRDALKPTAGGAAWDEAARRGAVEASLREEGASILVEAEHDAGWLHVAETRFGIHLGQLYLAPHDQGHGLGTAFLRWMAERAVRKHKQLTADLNDGNRRAQALYLRLGFVEAGHRGRISTLRFAGK